MSDIILVTEEEQGSRIDRFLAEIREDFSRSFIQKMIRSGSVRVNDRPVKAGYSICTGDCIQMDVPDQIEPDIAAEDLPLDIVYEDSDVILVNKPKGMVIHPAAGHYSGTMVNALMYHCRDGLSGINGVLRPGIVHRIDMDTTGIVIACKNDAAHNGIAAQLKEHSIKRRYYAIVCGSLQEEEGTIDAPIGRHPTDRKKMAINERNGKEAITHYNVIERFGAYTWIECALETGRTHQIRVHMASIGHPLLGDERYGGPSRYKSGKTLIPLQGQTLHAYLLGFVHPRTGQYMEFCVDLPAYFQALISSLRGESQKR